MAKAAAQEQTEAGDKEQQQQQQQQQAMDLPVIDLDVFRQSIEENSNSGSSRGDEEGGKGKRQLSEAARAECARAAEALITFGALVLHDGRVAEADNEAFLDLLEAYFAQPPDALRPDERPDLGYQVGVTLENTEKPRCAADGACRAVVEALAPEERPLGFSSSSSSSSSSPAEGDGGRDVDGQEGKQGATTTEPSPDPKCRFFWQMGERAPYPTRFPALNADNVVPAAPHIRDRWRPVMEAWGGSMKSAVEGLAQMAAVGLGLPTEAFTDAGRYGPHLLAPTASDLTRYGSPGTVLAGFHTDLNFLTIHGRSRYPGLNIWARNTGRRIPVRMPSPASRHPGLLLVQAGKQLEHLTGGLVRAGYHEVVVNEATVAAMEARRKGGRGQTSQNGGDENENKAEKEEEEEEEKEERQIRISSTFFWHLSSDYDLAPVDSLRARAADVRARQAASGRDEGREPAYPPMKVGEQVQEELKHIALMA